MRSVAHLKRELNDDRLVCSRSSGRWRVCKEKLEMIRIVCGGT